MKIKFDYFTDRAYLFFMSTIAQKVSHPHAGVAFFVQKKGIVMENIIYKIKLTAFFAVCTAGFLYFLCRLADGAAFAASIAQ
jgi:hypothetical protein